MSGTPMLWLTRPAEDSARMAQALTAHAIPTLIAPLTSITTQAITAPLAMPDALLLTSRHACPALASLPAAWRALPTYCVGESTAAYAQKAGFSHTMTGSGNVLALLQLLAADLPAGAHVCYLSGEDIALDPAPLLASRRISIERIIAYTATAIPAIPTELGDALASQQLQGVVFYSARSVQIAASLLPAHALQACDIYCLSLAIAAQAATLGGKRLLSAAHPTHESMMELLSTHAIKAPL